MARKRLSFRREFKLEAVGLMTDAGLSMAQAARDLGISESVLGRWKRQFVEDPAEAFPGKERLKPQDEELARLWRWRWAAAIWFHALKTELVNHRDYQTRMQVKVYIFEYIETFYNRSRRHS